MGALSNTLKMLTSSGAIDDTIVIPPEDITVEETPKFDFDEPRAQKKKKKKGNKLEADMNEFFKEVGMDKLSDDIFDNIMDSFTSDDEDLELRNSLVEMGRKYERETRLSAETSEIQKAFSANTKKISGLIEEVRKDKQILQQDLDYLHATRTRNAKAIADTYEVKSTLHNLELNAIKELNSMTKTQIELQMKAKAQKNEDVALSGMNGNLIQDLFNVGRKNIMDGIGGYAGISGADLSGEDELVKGKPVGSMDDAYNDDDNYVQAHFINEEDHEETDGEKFLKYKDAGVRYILDLTGGSNNIYAEDKDGNRINDYPMPTNIEDLSFDLDEKEGFAYDDYHRTYVLRK